MGTALVVTSGKGGVGKTTTSANIGTALALQGKRVVLLDLDIGLRNLDVVMGLSNRIIYDIVDVATGRAKLNQALIKDKRFDDLLYLLPAAQNAEKDGPVFCISLWSGQSRKTAPGPGASPQSIGLQGACKKQRPPFYASSYWSKVVGSIS